MTIRSLVDLFRKANPGEKYPYYKCPHCGKKSFNSNDIRHKYCGNCHFFGGQKPKSPSTGEVNGDSVL